MNWINNLALPKIRSLLPKREATPENLWVKCPESGEMVFHRDLEANQYVVPGSGYHMRIEALKRLELLYDGGKYERIEMPSVVQDPLKFRDEKRYSDRLKDARAKTGREDAIIGAVGAVEGLTVVAAVQDYEFIGGSLGMAAGEGIIKSIETAVARKAPFVMFCASGGARMQEGILSLMQMPRTTAALQALRDEGLPYIVVLTNPTFGGVTASYAMLGDIHLAEPGALIGFAGPRVIEQTIREKLPEGFQRSEYLLAHGMVDMVVHRHRMRETIGRLCRLLTGQSPLNGADAVKPADPAPKAEDTPKAAAEPAA